MKNILFNILLILSLTLVFSELLNLFSQPNSREVAKESTNLIVDVLFSTKLIYFYVIAVCGLAFVSTLRGRRY